MYHAVAIPHSASFILSSDVTSIMRMLFIHGVVIGTTCSDYPVLRVRLMRHLLSGQCTGGSFSGCRSLVQVTRDASVFPHVFCVDFVDRSGVLKVVGADVLRVYADFFAPRVDRNIRRHAKEEASNRSMSLRYLPFDPVPDQGVFT
ncbi:hypothetical protein ARMSODRAFT_438016 [Armillaria solidipes]|uniref:Uncharacterized protein n=1 Tax=Armillaria solidipes TaxID=1076256 RepID=A0A2H3BKZ3_9AGAR|nr:hypothetical protein ARMSODRAFT_438016 [Armillaria solidipes]